jgi:Family of unknown function (DUF5335)
MRTIEVPREAWARRLNEFTAIHDGWLVSLEVTGPEIGAQPQVDNLPLLGVSADRVDHDGSIAISVARSGAEHLTHIIRDVRHVAIEQTDEGADMAMQIEAGDGTIAILRFRAAALPETVDGLVA